MSNSTSCRTTIQAISDFKSVHGNRYDYSKFQYTKARNKGIIICKIHGEFMMTYDHHFHRLQNCPSCAHNKKQNTEECIDKFKSTHGNRYDYSLVVYNGNRAKVKIICKKHGIFEQEPLSHKHGRNCPNCSREKSIVDWRETLDEFYNHHGNLYDYSQANYTKSESKIKIICPIHGEFYQRPSIHKTGRGCKQCNAPRTWDRSSYIDRSERTGYKSFLYICKMSNENESFFKVGIALDGFHNRYRKRDRDKYTIELVTQYHGDSKLIWDLETQILRSMHHYKHKPNFDFSGKTECLSKIDSSVFDSLFCISCVADIKRVN